MNLIITGRAISNVFDGDKQLDKDTLLKGIKGRGKVQFPVPVFLQPLAVSCIVCMRTVEAWPSACVAELCKAHQSNKSMVWGTACMAAIHLAAGSSSCRKPFCARIK